MAVQKQVNIEITARNSAKAAFAEAERDFDRLRGKSTATMTGGDEAQGGGLGGGKQMLKDLRSQGRELTQMVRGMVVLEVAIGAASAALKGIGAIGALVSGDMQSFADSVTGLHKELLDLPIIGKAAKVGQSIGEMIFGDEADAERIKAEAAASAKRQAETDAALNKARRIIQGAATFGAESSRQSNDRIQDAGVTGITAEKLRIVRDYENTVRRINIEREKVEGISSLVMRQGEKDAALSELEYAKQAAKILQDKSLALVAQKAVEESVLDIQKELAESQKEQAAALKATADAEEALRDVEMDRLTRAAAGGDRETKKKLEHLKTVRDLEREEKRLLEIAADPQVAADQRRRAAAMAGAMRDASGNLIAPAAKAGGFVSAVTTASSSRTGIAEAMASGYDVATRATFRIAAATKDTAASIKEVADLLRRGLAVNMDVMAALN